MKISFLAVLSLFALTACNASTGYHQGGAEPGLTVTQDQPFYGDSSGSTY